MKFQLVDYLEKNKIELKLELLTLCDNALIRMSNSPDPLHDSAHVNNILNDLENFIREDDTVEQKHLNFNVLITAICWHDVWKSTKKQTLNLFNMIFEQLWDGMGSMKLFNDAGKKMGIDLETINKIKFCIKSHTDFYLGKRKSIESRILFDLDNLEL
jgi:hypothetical protein